MPARWSVTCRIGKGSYGHLKGQVIVRSGAGAAPQVGIAVAQFDEVLITGWNAEAEGIDGIGADGDGGIDAEYDER